MIKTDFMEPSTLNSCRVRVNLKISRSGKKMILCADQTRLDS